MVFFLNYLDLLSKDIILMLIYLHKEGYFYSNFLEDYVNSIYDHKEG